MYSMALKVYTCEEAARGPKMFLNIFCKLLQQKEPSPAWQWSWFQYQLTLLYSLSGQVQHLEFYRKFVQDLSSSIIELILIGAFFKEYITVYCQQINFFPFSTCVWGRPICVLHSLKWEKLQL
jgi:hypothetical protein